MSPLEQYLHDKGEDNSPKTINKIEEAIEANSIRAKQVKEAELCTSPTPTKLIVEEQHFIAYRITNGKVWHISQPFNSHYEVEVYLKYTPNKKAWTNINIFKIQLERYV